MKELNIKITEDALLNNTGFSVDALADANGYQEMVQNPDYVQEVGTEFLLDDNYQFLLDADGKKQSNPDYVPAQGEQLIANPETRTTHLANVIKKAGVTHVAEPVKKTAVRNAQTQVEDQFKAGIQAVVDAATVTVKE